MIKEIECTITGKVQMVMFRDFIQRKARALNISGTVENGEDGSVRVVAQGDEKSLQTFIDFGILFKEKPGRSTFLARWKMERMDRCASLRKETKNRSKHLLNIYTGVHFWRALRAWAFLGESQ